MIIADLNYLEDVVETTAIEGGSDYDVDSILKWADNLVADLTKDLKTQKTSTQKAKSAAKVKKVEKKVEKKVSGGSAVAYASVTTYSS